MRGELDAADQLYRAILAEDPNHFKVTHLLGVLKNQQGDFPAAVQHLAARYHHLTLPDPTARQLFFYDGLTYPLIEFTDVDGSTFLIPDSTAGEDPLRFLDVATRLLELRDGSWQRPATSPAPGGLIA